MSDILQNFIISSSVSCLCASFCWLRCVYTLYFTYTIFTQGREGEREKERGREGVREREGGGERERERDRDRGGERERVREREGGGEREGKR